MPRRWNRIWKLNKEETVKVLLDKYRLGTCSETELKQLVQFMREDTRLYDLLDETINNDWWEQILQNEKRDVFKAVKANSSRRRKLSYWSVAASLLVLVTAGLSWWFYVNSGSISYSTNYGERQQIELPDGSKVEMNANSELTWNKNWKRTGVRSVVLNGEAYFDVVKNRARQFQVNTGETIVKVLGTSFNVSNRRGDTEVYLNEGKVQLALPDELEITLSPGEKIRYDVNDKIVSKTKNETLHSAASWKTGVISFQKVLLKEIITELSDIYGINLICMDSELNQTIMDVGVPYMNWDVTKKSLELAMNVEIFEKGEKFIIRSKK